jgi:predicted DNA-binding transcriptional regulator YafY
LLNAIKNSNIIEFRHTNYATDTIKYYILEPYLLKEYLNRWYVFGYVDEVKDFRIFGIDRIENLNVGSEKFKRNKNINPVEYFENTIGLTYDEHKLQEVVLQATEIEAKYLRSQPLHSSQTELDNYKFKYFLTPNYELIQIILMRGTGLKVIKPNWLQKEIFIILQELLNEYK